MAKSSWLLVRMPRPKRFVCLRDLKSVRAKITLSNIKRPVHAMVKSDRQSGKYAISGRLYFVEVRRTHT
jgi:hypothetical protein